MRSTFTCCCAGSTDAGGAATVVGVLGACDCDTSAAEGVNGSMYDEPDMLCEPVCVTVARGEDPARKATKLAGVASEPGGGPYKAAFELNADEAWTLEVALEVSR